MTSIMCGCNSQPCDCKEPKPTVFDVFLDEMDRFMSCLRWDIKTSEERQKMWEALMAKISKNPDYEAIAIALAQIKIKGKLEEAKADEETSEDSIIGSSLLEDI